MKQVLQIAVIIGAGFLVTLSVARYSANDASWDASEEDAQRNERSTPRSFVLPATPGVALEQEKQASSSPGRIDVVGHCVGRLRALGYTIYGDDGMDNVKVLEAIVHFQVVRSLAATGRLDEPTKRALGCDSR